MYRYTYRYTYVYHREHATHFIDAPLLKLKAYDASNHGRIRARAATRTITRYGFTTLHRENGAPASITDLINAPLLMLNCLLVMLNARPRVPLRDTDLKHFTVKMVRIANFIDA